MFATVIAGVLVFAFSQLFDEYILKPIHKYTLLKSRIAYSLAYYGKEYMNPLSLNGKNTEKMVNAYQTASEEIRKVAAELKGFIEERPLSAFLLPSEKDMLNAYTGLVGLSNSLFSGNQEKWHEHTTKYEQTVISALKLKQKR